MQAAIFLEMAGGNVETAVEIYLSSQGGWESAVAPTSEYVSLSLKPIRAIASRGDVPMADAAPAAATPAAPEAQLHRGFFQAF